MFIDAVLIGILILANGFFAAAEMALVTTRGMRLKMLVKAGDQRAAKVLAVQDNPGDFLAMVQIGITLVGTTAGAVGGAEAVQNLRISRHLSPASRGWHRMHRKSHW
jgi:putative hemolysin